MNFRRDCLRHWGYLVRGHDDKGIILLVYKLGAPCFREPPVDVVLAVRNLDPVFDEGLIKLQKLPTLRDEVCRTSPFRSRHCVCSPIRGPVAEQLLRGPLPGRAC